MLVEVKPDTWINTDLIVRIELNRTRHALTINLLATGDVTYLDAEEVEGVLKALGLRTPGTKQG